MLGVRVDPDKKKRTRKSVADAVVARRRRKQRKESYDQLIEQDEFFAYIAGYTSAGFAYGITWEEWEKLESGGALRFFDDDELERTA